MSLAELIQRAPKALLHDHLDGGVRPRTVIELAQEYGRVLQHVAAAGFQDLDVPVAAATLDPIAGSVDVHGFWRELRALAEQTAFQPETGDAPGSQGVRRENIGQYSSVEQRSEAGCSAGRMQTDFHHGLRWVAVTRTVLPAGVC